MRSTHLSSDFGVWVGSVLSSLRVGECRTNFLYALHNILRLIDCEESVFELVPAVVERDRFTFLCMVDDDLTQLPAFGGCVGVSCRVVSVAWRLCGWLRN